MSANWKPTAMKAQVALANLIVERTPHGWWRWCCYIGTRLVDGGASAEQAKAMRAAEEAAAKHGQAST